MNEAKSTKTTRPIVEVSGLTKHFGDRPVVKGLDFSIFPGESVGLLGPNGAGKTTTIRMLLGLVRPTDGHIKVFDIPLSGHLRRIKQRIGVSPQMDNLDPDLSVLENLLTYASYFGIKRSSARDRAESLLGFFALGNRSGEIIEHLSGGQRRRLLLARALINSPDLLILDEPTVGLDPQARHLIWERLGALRRHGTTMLLTSHYMEEVSSLATRVIIVDQGRIIASGKPASMVRQMVGIEVLEVSDRSDELKRLATGLRSCDVELDMTKNRLFIYVKKWCPELEAIALSHRQVIKRPASLEDLFLKLTGRTLRED